MQDERLDAVRARVNRYGNSGDTEDLLHPAAVRDVEALLRAHEPPPIAVRHAAGINFYVRHVAAPGNGDLERAESLLRPVYDHVPDLVERMAVLAEVPSKPLRLNPQPVAVFTFAGQPLDVLDEVIAMTRHAVRSAGDEAEATSLRMSLAEAIELRFARTEDLADLDDAIAAAQESVAATPPGELGRGTRLFALHEAYRLRYTATNEPADLEAALRTVREAVEQTSPEHMDYVEMVYYLGETHLARYQRTGRREDAAVAKDVAKQLMRAAPKDHPLYAMARDLRDRARRR
ncbi:hypothetical protein [Paractinoplanes lichenicola]|uniref:Uncharacterized protein n=1 Tax=Paractinoplanes lichenicola TaxID=2802976 RepID=A0ABS1VNS4_9ACTN|nr:hypothetical protein [Actinoplanes lichenicola]MBL7255779.1 hypothetical protein [Actinoplanes lichenicola]